jgi:hypothetical protein
MKSALHALGCVIVLPYVGLAAFMLFVQRAAGTKDMPSLFNLMLSVALALIDWAGLLVLAVWIAVLVLGLVPSTQRIGAVCLLALAIASLAAIVAIQPTPLDLGQVLFLAPCVLVAMASGWPLLGPSQ